VRLNRYRILYEDDLSRIHEASLKLLSETGMVIHSEKVVKLLQEAGAKVDWEKMWVRIPKDLIEATLNHLPSKIVLYDRNKNPAFTLGNNESHLASGHNAIYVLDSKMLSRRAATKKDVAGFARLGDALENIHVVGVQAMPQDVVPKASLLHAVEAVFNNTEKHLYFSPENSEVTRAIIEMARAVVGDGSLSETPILTCQLSSTSPLSWEGGAAEAVVEAARAGIPLVFLPQPYAGVTAPITLAGVLTVHNAELLSGIVISQLVKKGTPVVYGSAWTTFDMRQANVVIGGPETALLRIAGADLAGFYHIPSHTIGPDSDSHCLDEQNAWEKFLTLHSAFTSGVNLVVNAGMFATGLTVSFEQLVIDNEMAAIVYRFIEGIDVSPETIALEVIKRVGPKGNFLEEPHTLKYLRRSEHWQPDLSSRSVYEKWMEEGGKNVVGKACEISERILKHHQPKNLSERVRSRLSQIIKDFEEKSLPR
jgi:trimethylamine--corrinoid protein Co-methyltransferase